MLVPCLSSSAHRGLRLSPFHEDDVSEIYVGWMRDPAVIRFTEVAPDSATLENCRDYVRRNNANPNAILWRILAGDDGHVGNIRLEINPKHRRGELALIVGRTDLHGKGIGTGAIQLASAYAFDALDLHKLTCGIYADNGGSITAFERNGYRIEASFRRHVIVDGAYQDVLRLARFAADKTLK